ncbi:UNVERIFIED_CONTAM: Epimerase family protein SDR39U1, chloroplastic [Sesamum calycinum]|uniref:Epimerase family protein SDR39U1, chloroplastic n=1 Tax=Sesamum calycinum TaxID=2727403 RepID=A0AAW2R890_9LAMI
MSLATASYLARRAAQKERVRILYRRALKDTLNWAVHRHLFYPDADALREKFETNRNVEDIELIDRMIAAGEATYSKWRHPDPYIVPWAPVAKFCRNPTPPPGALIFLTFPIPAVSALTSTQLSVSTFTNAEMRLNLAIANMLKHCSNADCQDARHMGEDAVDVALHHTQFPCTTYGPTNSINQNPEISDFNIALVFLISKNSLSVPSGKYLKKRNKEAEIVMKMELCGHGATSITWAKSISPSLHFPQSFSVWRFRRMSISCVNSRLNSGESQKADEMIVSITGATGFIGKRLVQRLQADNHRVRVLTRSRSKALSIFPVRDYPGLVIAEEPEWGKCIQGSTAVVNLAGTPISTRWSPEIKKDIKESRIKVTSKIKKDIMESRTKVTSKVVDLINSSQDELCPKVLISATAIGYYGSSETSVFDENSPSGDNYLAEVCRAWEAAALRVNKDVRTALIRIGLVLGKEGGALGLLQMIPPFKMYAGGHLGSGRQWFSWIHVDDMVNLIYEALRNPAYKGPINGTAPNPVRLSEFCNHLGSTLGRPSWLPVPEFILKFALGEGASVALEGQNVIPARAKELGFAFKYTDVREALRSIVNEKTQA